MPNWATHIAQSKNLAFGGQQRVLDLLGLNLQTAGRSLVGSGAQTWVLWKMPALLTLSLSKDSAFISVVVVSFLAVFPSCLSQINLFFALGTTVALSISST